MNADRPLPDEDEAARQTAVELGQVAPSEQVSCGSPSNTIGALGVLLRQAATAESVEPSHTLRETIEARLRESKRLPSIGQFWSSLSPRSRRMALAASLLVAVCTLGIGLATRGQKEPDEVARGVEEAVPAAIENHEGPPATVELPRDADATVGSTLPHVPAGPTASKPDSSAARPSPKIVAPSAAEPEAIKTTPPGKVPAPPKTWPKIEPAVPRRPTSVVLNVPSLVELPGPGVKPTPKVEEHFISTARQAFAPVPLEFDRGGYEALRATILANRRPRARDVALEDLLNSFAQHYPQPATGDAVAVSLEAAPCPWSEGHRLLLVGVQARQDADGLLVAEDVRIQLEFNRGEVIAWRLLGYENRRESGLPQPVRRPAMYAGQSVTVLYEIVPLDHAQSPKSKPVREKPAHGGRMLTLTVEHRGPGGNVARSVEYRDADKAFAAASTDFQFTAGVASFAMLLRNSPFRGNASWETTERILQANLGDDPRGERAELLALVRRAARLTTP